MKFAYIEMNGDKHEVCGYRNYHEHLHTVVEGSLTPAQKGFCGRLLEIQKAVASDGVGDKVKISNEMHAKHTRSMVYAAVFCYNDEGKDHTAVYVGESGDNGSTRWGLSGGHLSGARDLVNSEIMRKNKSPIHVALLNYPPENIYIFVVDRLVTHEDAWIECIGKLADEGHNIDKLNGMNGKKPKDETKAKEVLEDVEKRVADVLSSTSTHGGAS
eukprot:TRINITY_DN5533_c0_g6_i1.p1 TRINITY_DN5533_c0_g6~~TRINITY_DN5533_c0_g6_i1.p1  ORF type:complete len:215 (+),score=28.09 TRINITY_DN5533_c0_g6_i1:417-1061(+)